MIADRMLAPARAARRRERGQSALAECGLLLPLYVVLIFSCQTFGEMGLLKKKAIIAARYTGFGGESEDVKKALLLAKWEEVEFGEEKIQVQIDSGSAAITYDPMKIMQEDSGADEEDIRAITGGLGTNLDLSDSYSVDK